MGHKNNIERNKIDYLLTDIMPVEISELFSYGKFYEFLLEHQTELDRIVKELMKLKASGKEYLFNGGKWASTPLKYNILKGVDGIREINLTQPISALNIYLFIECYQKEILGFLENNNCFSLRYHRKNNDLFYKRKSNRLTEYFAKTSKKINKSVLQQTGAYFKIHKFNSVSSFTNSRLWQQCNFKYKYFAKVDYKSCFSSIYTHTYKWIIERNTIDSKEAKNSNLFIVIDRVLQNINGKSSNGVIVGPEFSRMIAEILLQHIDKEILQNLQTKGLSISKDFRIFRYVDDIYITILKNFKPIFKDYVIMVMGEQYKPYEFIKLLRNTKDGSTGIGLTQELGKTLETAYDTLLYQLSLVKSGGNKKGFLKAQRRLGQEEINTLKRAWKNMYANNSENVVVLNNGLEFQESSNSSVEMQLDQNKRTLADEINKIFHIYENFELTFKEAIYPIVKAFETALNRDLLLEREKGKYFFEFDVKEIIKASLRERYEAYKLAKETGFLTLNEIRKTENLEEIEGLDVINVGLGAVLYNADTHTYFTPNTATTTDMGMEKVLTDKVLDTEFEESGNSSDA